MLGTGNLRYTLIVKDSAGPSSQIGQAKREANMAGKDKSAAIFCGVFSALIFAGPSGLLAQTRLESLAQGLPGNMQSEYSLTESALSPFQAELTHT
jgi:hypothetical protein